MLYTEEELKKYWKVKCPRCGWKGLSRDCAGGNAIADTGDYDDILCPECIKKEIGQIVEDDD
jgi:phage FluMu protein Com